MESRYLKEQLETMLGGAEIFLDFDNAQDLGVLLQHVRNSDVFLVLLTESVMSRPWCILEIHAAVIREEATTPTPSPTTLFLR